MLRKASLFCACFLKMPLKLKDRNGRKNLDF